MRKLNTDQVAQLVTAALLVHAYLEENPQARARIWLRVHRVCTWGAYRLGRIAMTAELAYRRETV
jgi:hypothetical protein